MVQNNQNSDLLPMYLQAAFAKKLTMYYMSTLQILPIVSVIIIALIAYSMTNIITTIIALYLSSGLFAIYLGYIIVFMDKRGEHATIKFINNIVFQYDKEQKEILLYIIHYTKSDDIFPAIRMESDGIYPAIRNVFYIKNNELILAVMQYLFKPIIYKSKNININLFKKER